MKIIIETKKQGLLNLNYAINIVIQKWQVIQESLANHYSEENEKTIEEYQKDIDSLKEIQRQIL